MSIPDHQERMNRCNYIKVNFIKRCITILFLVSIIGCNNEDDIPDFADSTNLRLKFHTSYRKDNPDFVFTYAFNYDSENRLISIQGNSLGATVDFKYDSEGRLNQVGDYVYYYNDEGNVYKIKNENLAVHFGKYDSTMVNYTNGKITSLVESFTGDTSKRTNLLNISYNNKDQIRLAVATTSTLYFESGQEFVNQKDKETYTFDNDGNIEQVISEIDYDTSDFIEFIKTYAFDNYNNPIQLILKSTGIKKNAGVINLRPLGFNNSLSWNGYLNYFSNNRATYTSIPQTDDDGYVQYSFNTDYIYNKYGYPVSAEETQKLLNRDIEIIKFLSWEYEEY